MNSRRTFIKQTGLLVAGATILPALPSLASAPAKRVAGLQLYSLRDLLPKDVKNVIAAVAEAGYGEVETYGYSKKDGFWGLDAKAFGALLKQHGLKAPSGHYDMDYFMETGNSDVLKTYIEAANVLGAEYVTVPYLGDHLRKNLDGFKKVASRLNEAGALCKASGLRLAYHNHDFEFKKYGDTTGYEVMLKETDKKLVDFEMDLYWVVRSGNDPLKLIAEHPKRFTMWHVKDMDKTNHNLNTEVGKGAIDFKAIFAKAKQSGAKHFFVEHETNYQPNELGSIKTSCAYVKENLL